MAALILQEGLPLPPASLSSTGGTWTPLRTFAGRPCIFFLWGAWASQTKSLLALEDVHRRHRETVRIVGIAFDVTGHVRPAGIVRRLGISFPCLVDNSCLLSRLWGVSRLPLTIVVDPDQFIERVGALPDPALVQAALEWRSRGGKTRIPEPALPRPAPAREEALLQHVTNLLGRNRTEEAIRLLEEISRNLPENAIVREQVDVLRNPDKYSPVS